MASRHARMSSGPGDAANGSNDIQGGVALRVGKLNINPLGNLGLHFACWPVSSLV